MKAGRELLAQWERCRREAPGAPLVWSRENGRWLDRQAVEELRRQWVAKLPPVKGAPVLFQLENGPSWLGLLLALWEGGAVAVPLDPLTREGERERLMKALRPAAVVTGDRVVSGERARVFRAPVVLGKLTSGSTGAPRALYFTGAQMMADARQIESGMGIGEGHVNLAAIPFGHSYGLGNLVFPALLEGRPIACASAVFPHVVVEEARQAGANVFPATPSLLRSLLSAGLDRRDWPGLQKVISAGARLDPELARAFREAFVQPVHNFYGSSESGGIAFDVSGELGVSGRGVGVPLPGVNLSTTPSGRLAVTSASVFSYGNRRSRGRPTVVLADRGEIAADGTVVLHGRAGPVLKLGARRLAAGEVEAVLRAVPGVSDCHVSLCPDARKEILGAVVAGRVERETLRMAARRALAAWKVPKRIRIVTALPLTARGKPDRQALQALLHHEESSSHPH